MPCTSVLKTYKYKIFITYWIFRILTNLVFGVWLIVVAIYMWSSFYFSVIFSTSENNHLECSQVNKLLTRVETFELNKWTRGKERKFKTNLQICTGYFSSCMYFVCWYLYLKENIQYDKLYLSKWYIEKKINKH